ncbi:Solute carrier family 40 member [Thalictrum thalictroides]|uniref:Solute carrier family 40 member n=1 Tax=Thalictrum thalictroides TaxID=46969 RepID=A0A7J6V4H9_THATH|nr:Solute carrier family 40 member [Thalictrum thalictroides]
MRKPLLRDSRKQEKEDSNSNDSSSSSSLLIYLYVGHFLSRWGARMWEFSVGLYMINIWPESLLVTAIYGAVEAASTTLLGPIIGRLVDRLSYIQVLRLWLFIQNVSFIVAGGTVTALLIYPGLRITHFPVFISLVVITNISGAVGVLATLAGTLLVEREWVVVISNGQPPEALTRMNSVIRRIDLVCKLFAPVVSGFIISFISLKDSAVTFTLWNIVSVLIIYWLLSSVYNGIPALTENNQKRNARFPPNDSIESPPRLQETKSLLPHKGSDSAMRENDWKHHIIERFSKIPYVQAWTVYLQQDVVLPGIALALLFFTVLSFGTLMTATLQWEGVPAYVIGIMRGISAMIGIAATLLYPILHSRLSTLRTGLWSIWMQWTFLLVCVASVWVQNSHISAWLLMGGVAASRLGLWMFDLSVMQQMQDHVRESDRCVVGGVQNSIQSMMDLLTCIMGIFISNPKSVVTAIYGAVEAASTTLFGPIIGQLVDRLSYIQVLRLWLFIQNVSFIAAGGTVTTLLIYPGLRITHFPVFISLVTISLERLFQDINDSYPTMGRRTCLCYWYNAWNKRYDWYCCNSSVSHFAFTSLNSEDRAMVYLDAAMQWTFLLLCVASEWVQNSHLSAWLLMGGVAASRLGL